MEKVNRVYFTNSQHISNYYHCFVDFLPIIYVLYKKYDINEILFDAESRRIDFIKPIIFYLFDNKLKVEKIPSHLLESIEKSIDHNNTKWKCKINNDFAQYIRQFREKKQCEFNKILIKRNNRYICKEIISFLLNDHGFVEVELEKYNIIDQINLFYNAQYVIGSHGAGLTNMLFANKDTKILELNNGFNPKTYIRLSKFSECSYKAINSDSFSKLKHNYDLAKRSEFNMDLITFRKIFNNL
jgi:capsular polysaccharide biosynthesis protein